MNAAKRLISAMLIALSVQAAAAPAVAGLNLVSVAHAASCNDGGVKVSGALGITGNCVGGKDNQGNKTNPIFALLSKGINIFSAIFGLVLVLMITISGFRYITSGGNPDNAKGAKEQLEAAITGLILFILMWGILNILIPGGIFRAA